MLSITQTSITHSSFGRLNLLADQQTNHVQSLNNAPPRPPPPRSYYAWCPNPENKGTMHTVPRRILDLWRLDCIGHLRRGLWRYFLSRDWSLWSIQSYRGAPMTSSCTATSVNWLSLLKPKFRYADFHRNFSAGKVVDTNHESRGHKPSRHVEMFATKSVTSPRQTRLCRSNGI